MQPTFLLKLLRSLCITQLVLLVVRFQQILNDGSRLPEVVARVRVLNGWDSAVWVDVLERRILQLTEVHDLGFVWEIELLEHYGDLPWIGSL